MKRYGLAFALSVALATGAFTGCATQSATSASAAQSTPAAAVQASSAPTSTASLTGSTATTTTSDAAQESPIDPSSLFTDRDLEQTADTSNATAIEVTSGSNVNITEEGVYVLSGTADNVTVTVNADDSAKVQLVLDGLSITNETEPAIYVASADKVFVTTAEGSTNTLSTTATFSGGEEGNVDGVIFAKDDIVLNGTGTLVVKSSANGIVGKDDVKVTGGAYDITASNHGIQGKDGVSIADGTFTITAGKDGIHGENSDDAASGCVYIGGGSFTVKADSDAIESVSHVRIDGGTFTLDAAEGIESTFVQINDGTIGINASDDGVNATSKSTSYAVKIEVNGGNLTVNMGSGDTDALDANGDLIINGGTVDITAQSPFDFDGQGAINGGTVTVNGQQVTELTNQMMGGMGGMGGRGDMNGSMGGQGQRPDMGDSQDASRGGMRPDGGYGKRGGMGPQGMESGQSNAASAQLQSLPSSEGTVSA